MQFNAYQHFKALRSAWNLLVFFSQSSIFGHRPISEKKKLFKDLFIWSVYYIISRLHKRATFEWKQNEQKQKNAETSFMVKSHVY